MIPDAMHDKAQSVIADLCAQSYREANTMPDGRRRKRHRAYSVPAIASALVNAIGRADREAVSAILIQCGTTPELLEHDCAG